MTLIRNGIIARPKYHIITQEVVELFVFVIWVPLSLTNSAGKKKPLGTNFSTHGNQHL
jgi:hypothetical protein